MSTVYLGHEMVRLESISNWDRDSDGAYMCDINRDNCSTVHLVTTSPFNVDTQMYCKFTFQSDGNSHYITESASVNQDGITCM